MAIIRVAVWVAQVILDLAWLILEVIKLLLMVVIWLVVKILDVIIWVLEIVQIKKVSMDIYIPGDSQIFKPYLRLVLGLFKINKTTFTNLTFYAVLNIFGPNMLHFYILYELLLSFDRL